MNPKLQIKTEAILVTAFLLIALVSGHVWSHPITETYYLAAQELTQTMPGGEIITFWGFAQYEDPNFTILQHAPTVPGPTPRQRVVGAASPARTPPWAASISSQEPPGTLRTRTGSAVWKSSTRIGAAFSWNGRGCIGPSWWTLSTCWA